MVGIGTKLTLAEYLALPDSDVYYEFVDGEAIPKVSPKYFHSTLQFALCRLIGVWCKSRGRVLPEWAILLKRQGKDWAPVPDLTYISYARLPKSWRRNEACPAIPELAIEIISPDQSMKEFEEKAKDYLAAGVTRVWVIDPEAILIRSFLPDGSSQVYTDNTPIVDELLPGLELTTRQIFEEAELID
ncbi:Uma2 family endonuclease [Tychonema sp. LEGE 07203]|uniref:Uma2 family endonuclease n=1 Tax=Tychonema sp. LEGE 07203 TaxID=1828671 RepID=UPI0018828E4B|nr:Uma2 family endonuclease [Tychonema sp. LEGE 07203]MBE9093894.1 Uma2 family endonuclease [Tychonema sp. LEGE 07203]